MQHSISTFPDQIQAALEAALYELRDKVVVVRRRNGRMVIVPLSRIAKNPDGTVRILPRTRTADGEGAP